MHHAHEDVDYGSHEDLHRHRWQDDEWAHPREAAERSFHPYHYFHSYENKLPVNEARKEHVLEDEEDPTICFVKAYARKPLGEPKKKGPSANSIPRSYYNDYEDDGFSDEYDNYSDSYSENYYEEENEVSSEEEMTSNEEGTSSEEGEESDQNEYDFNDDWNAPDHYKNKGAQFFDLAN